MTPIRLEIENFMNHSHSVIDFTLFNTALIVGRSKQNDAVSNGIGKTTIYSAIDYALFGEVPVSTLDKVIREGAEKCLITFDFGISNAKYRIVRGRSSKGRSELRMYEWINDKFESIGQRGMPETSKKIAEIIKINYKSFIHSIKFKQADFTSLADGDPDSRKKILKEPLNLIEYTRLEKIASERQKPVKKEIERLEANISMLADPELEIKAAEVELHVHKSTVSARAETIEKLTATINEKNISLNELKKGLTASDSETHEKINNIIKRTKELKSIISKASERVQESSRIIKDNQSAISTLNNKLAELDVLKTESSTKTVREEAVIRTELEKVNSDELYGTKLLATYQAEYDHANKSIPNGNFCTACLQPITEEHRQKCTTEAEQILTKKSGQISSTETNLKRCKNKKINLELELKESISFERNLASINQNIQKATSELELRNKNVTEASKRLSDASHDMQVSQVEHDELNKTLTSLKDLVKNVDSASSEINNQILKLADDIKVYERSLQNVRNELSTAQTGQGQSLQKLETAKENLQKLVQYKEELLNWRKKLKISQIGTNGFSPSGIPTFIINTILDELQSSTNEWLSKLRSELRIEFNKDVEFFYRVNDKLRDWDQLSIGQRVRFMIALKLGLSSVIQERLGIDIKLLEFDEVEAFLDQAGVEAFADIIKILETNFKVLVISHNSYIKEKIINKILVEGDEHNGSSVRMVTNY